MNITQWPQEERPREKLLLRGANALSDAELLAIFIRCGVKGKTAVDVARDSLVQFGNIKKLLDLEQREFCQCAGLGMAKYVQLQAALELSRRYITQSLDKEEIIKDVVAAKLYCTAKLGQHKREVFAVVFLDSNYRILRYDELFYGTINRAAVYPREVVRRALLHNAAAVILTHNHISDVALPSDDDKQVTKHLKQTLALMEIKVLDHIIVSNGDCFSFAENKELFSA